MWGGPFRSPRMFFPGAPAWFGLGICVKCSPVAFQPFFGDCCVRKRVVFAIELLK